jgi:hypothetical protein
VLAYPTGAALASDISEHRTAERSQNGTESLRINPCRGPAPAVANCGLCDQVVEIALLGTVDERDHLVSGVDERRAVWIPGVPDREAAVG